MADNITKNDIQKWISEGTKNATKNITLALEETGSAKILKSMDKVSRSYTSLNKKLEDLNDTYKTLGISASKEAMTLEKDAKKMALVYKDLLKNKEKLGKSLDLGEIKIDSKAITSKIKNLQKSFTKLGLPIDQIEKVKKLFSQLDTKGIGEAKSEIASLRNIMKSAQGVTQGMVEEVDSLAEASSDLEDPLKKTKNLYRSIKKSDIYSELDKDTQKHIEQVLKLKDATKAEKEEMLKTSESITSKFGEALSKTEKKIESINALLFKKKVYQINLDTAQARLQGFLNEIRTSSFELEREGISPTFAIKNEEELSRIDSEILGYRKELADVTEKLENSTSLTTDELKEQEKLEQKLKKDINERLESSEEILKQTQAYTGAMRSVLAPGDKIANNFRKWGAYIQVSNEQIFKSKGAMGELFKNVSDKVSKLGPALKAFGVPLAVAQASMSFLKWTGDMQGQAATMYKGISETGMTVGASADNVGSIMSNRLDEAINLTNNLKAATINTSKAFSMSKDQILGVVSGLNQAGIRGDILSKSMKENGKNIYDAAKEVRTYSLNMAVADGAVTQMIGNMSYNFGKSFQGIESGFSDITEAQKISGIEGNRFLGIVQTATAGLSSFENQVVGVAQAMAALSKNARLSKGDVEGLVKGAAQLGATTDGLIKPMTQLSKQGQEDIIKLFEARKKATEEKLKTAKGEDKAKYQKQLERETQKINLMKSGGITGKASAMTGDTEANLILQKDLLKKARDLTGGGEGDNEFAFRKMAEGLDVSQDVIKAAIENGLKNLDQLDVTGGKTVKGDKKDQTAKALIENNKTQNVMENALSSAKESLIKIAGNSWVTMGAAVATSISTGIMAANSLKNFTKAGGGLDVVKDLVTSKGGPSIGKEAMSASVEGVKSLGTKTGLTNVAGLAKTGLKSGGAIAAGGTAALVAAYEGYQQTQEDVAKAKEGGATEEGVSRVKTRGYTKTAGGAVGAGLGAWGGAAAGAAIGSVVPVVGTVIGGLIGAAVGGWLGKKGGDVVTEATTNAVAGKIDERGELVPEVPPMPELTVPTSLQNKPSKVEIVKMRPEATSALVSKVPENLANQSAPGGIDNSTGATVNINVQSNDPQQLVNLIQSQIMNSKK